jgi:hypothetical protein
MSASVSVIVDINNRSTVGREIPFPLADWSDWPASPPFKIECEKSRETLKCVINHRILKLGGYIPSHETQKDETEPCLRYNVLRTNQTISSAHIADIS